MSNDEQQQQRRFEAACTEVGQHVSVVQANTKQMRSLAQHIGSGGDSETLRAKLHETAHQTRSACQQATELLRSQLAPMCSGRPAWRVKMDRLVDQLTKVAADFQEAQRQLQAKEKAAAASAAAAADADAAAAAGNGEDVNPFGFDSVAAEQQQQQQRQAELQLREAEQRESQLHQLEQDIVGLNEVFKDLAHMVQEQGEHLDSIEDHVSHAVAHVEEGNKNLNQAVTYKRSARRKKIILAVIIIVVLIAIGIGIYFAIPKGS